MQNNSSFSWTDEKVMRQVFVYGSIYFLLSALYSLIHYREKFLLDSTAHIFYISNFKHFVNAAQREIIYLQQLLPLLFAKAGMGIKWLMVGYVLNVFILYYIFFLIIIKLFRDSLSAILLVLVHAVAGPYNYFMLVEEALPGVCALVVLFSLVRSYHTLQYKKAGWILGCILMVLVVRSHPVAIAGAACASLLLAYTYRKVLLANWQVCLVFLILGGALVAVKFLSLNAYDAGVISNTKPWHVAVAQIFSVYNLQEMLYYLVYSRLFFSTLSIVALTYLLYNKKWVMLIVLSISVLMAMAVFNLTLPYNIQFTISDLNNRAYDRFSEPFRIVVLTAFCYWVLAAINRYSHYKVSVLVATLYLGISYIRLDEQLEISQGYMRQAHKIIATCRAEGVQKACINVSHLNPNIPVHSNCYQDILVWSSEKGPDSSIHVVYVTDSTQAIITQLDSNRIILDEGAPSVTHEILNSNYYRLPYQQYTLVSIE